MNDLPELKKSLVQCHPFSEMQLAMFIDKVSVKKFLKKDFLVKKNQVCTSLSFILAGSFRLYTETEHRELTLKFFTEDCWVSDIESLLVQKPSNVFIEASEDSIVGSISLRDIHNLMDLHPCFIMLNGLLANLSISTEQLIALTSRNPDDRYRDLLLKNPEWINRFPQRQIASYLGITPETLSRVRARLV